MWNLSYFVVVNENQLNLTWNWSSAVDTKNGQYNRVNISFLLPVQFIHFNCIASGIQIQFFPSLHVYLSIAGQFFTEFFNIPVWTCHCCILFKFVNSKTPWLTPNLAWHELLTQHNYILQPLLELLASKLCRVKWHRHFIILTSILAISVSRPETWELGNFHPLAARVRR